MTTNELLEKFNNLYGMSTPWPSEYKVDKDTYADVCKLLFSRLMNGAPESVYFGRELIVVRVSLGLKGGPLFHGVEILLEDDK
jgi:hypothetical protein